MVKDAELKKTDKFDMSEAYKKPSLYGTVLTDLCGLEYFVRRFLMH